MATINAIPEREGSMGTVYTTVSLLLHHHPFWRAEGNGRKTSAPSSKGRSVKVSLQTSWFEKVVIGKNRRYGHYSCLLLQESRFARKLSIPEKVNAGVVGGGVPCCRCCCCCCDDDDDDDAAAAAATRRKKKKKKKKKRRTMTKKNAPEFEINLKTRGHISFWMTCHIISERRTN